MTRSLRNNTYLPDKIALVMLTALAGLESRGSWPQKAKGRRGHRRQHQETGRKEGRGGIRRRRRRRRSRQDEERRDNRRRGRRRQQEIAAG